MKGFAIAFAVVGVFAAFSHCAVEEARFRKEERMFRVEFCEKQGGRWAYGWGGQYCDFPEKGGA